MPLSQVAQTVNVSGGILDSGLVWANQVSPAMGVTIIDSGPLQAGTYRFILMTCPTIGFNGGTIFELQHRDAANAANIRALHPAGAVGQNFLSWTAEMAVNERIRWGTYLAAFGSNIACSLSWEKVT